MTEQKDNVRKLPSDRKPGAPYQGKKSDAPFFVFTGKGDSREALPFFLDNFSFSSYVSNWKDKKGKPGIALLGQDKEKKGVIICYNDALRDEAIKVINAHLEIMGD